MTVVLFKVMLAVASGLLGVCALRTRLMELPEKAFRRGVLALQLVPAMALFVALYVVGHQEPTSDVPGFYVPAARAALAGQVPFRDFTLSYAPLFAYLGAGLVFLWNSGKVFALFAIVINAAALIWWHEAASASCDQVTARHCTVLYATSGHVLVQALLGTNQAWIAAGLAASALLIVRDRSAASGAAQALAACGTKVLAHLFWPILWICARHRARWAASAIVPTAGLYMAFVAIGAGPGLLYPLRHEGELISSGNIPYLLDPMLSTIGSLERITFDVLAMTALAIATAWLYFRARTLDAHNRRALLLVGLALTGVIFMLFSKKSATGYVIFVMYPMVLVVVSGITNLRARVGFLLAFNALLVAEPTIWFRMEGYRWPLHTWFALRGPAVAGFVCLDIALLACYVYVAWLSARGVQRTVDGATASRNTSQSAAACSHV